MVTDPKLIKEALTRVEFAGRPSFGDFDEIFFGKDAIDIVLADFGREWEVLRKVAHTAVRKFAVNERLPIIVNRKVAIFLKEIKEQNWNKPFDPTEYLSFLMMSLLATTAFEKEFKMSDPDFRILYDALRIQNDQLCNFDYIHSSAEICLLETI